MLQRSPARQSNYSRKTSLRKKKEKIENSQVDTSELHSGDPIRLNGIAPPSYQKNSLGESKKTNLSEVSSAKEDEIESIVSFGKEQLRQKERNDSDLKFWIYKTKSSSQIPKIKAQNSNKKKIPSKVTAS